jgi:hypothetical protein
LTNLRYFFIKILQTDGKWEAFLAIGFAAVFHGGDAHSVSVLMETNAIITDPQPELRRFDTLEPFDVAFAGIQIAGQCVEDTQAVS